MVWILQKMISVMTVLLVKKEEDEEQELMEWMLVNLLLILNVNKNTKQKKGL